MKLKVLAIVICLFLLFLLVALIDSFKHNYSDSPEQSDVIVMLGGGDAGRIQKASELYKEGYAEYVLITPVGHSSNRSAQEITQIIASGIPEEALILESDATSTYTNATITMDIMREHVMTSALIVTSDYHIKRSKYIYEKVNDGTFNFKYISALSSDGLKWYEKSDSERIWYSELYKIWGYRLGLYRWID